MARDGTAGGAGTTEGAWPGRGQQGALGHREGVVRDGGAGGPKGAGRPPESVLLPGRRPERWSVRSQVTF